MHEVTKQHVAYWLNQFPEVRWDRLTDEPEAGFGQGEVIAYGWLDRDDGRSDFLLLDFFPAGERPVPTTSSARLSEEFMRRVYSEQEMAAGAHVECQRVEDVLGDLVANKIVLSPQAAA